MGARQGRIRRERSVLLVLAAAQRRGAELEGMALADELKARGRPVSVVALIGGAGHAALPVDVLGKSPYSVSTIVGLRRRMAEADLVVAFGSTTLPACALAGIGTRTRFVYRSIGDPRAWVRGRFHRWRTGFLFRRAVHVVALWSEVAQGLGQLYGLSPERVSVISNARAPLSPPVNTVDRLAERRKYGVSASDPVVAVIGALSEEKRVELAIEVAAELPEVHLLVVGDGPQRPTLEQQAHRELGDRVTFTGAVEDVVPVLALTDVLLVTSRTEGMPGVVIEAGLASVPTVSTPVGAISEMVTTGVSGYVASSDTAKGLADGVRLALANRDRWGEAARRQMTAHYTWSVVAPQWDELLDVVAGRA